MRAAVIRQHGGAEVLEYEARYPDPRPAKDEVLIKVGATSLNYHDIFTRRGMPGIKVPLPCIAGIDFAGEVVEVGTEVNGWRNGDRVLVDPIDRVTFGGLIGEMRPGGLAELCAVPAHHLVKLPDDVSFEAASCLPVAYGTALRMMVTNGRIKAGERVLILGASGGVGTCCVQLAKNAGCYVIACASTPAKLERLTTLGADEVIDYTKDDFVKTIHARYGKPHRRTLTGGADVVVNFTGGDTWVPSLRALRRQGRLLTCGATAGYDPKEDIRFIWTFELQVLGSNGWMREELVDLVEMVRRKEIVPVIDRVLPLEEAATAFQLIEQRAAFGKVVVKP
jgi:alcohol dehydrogenase